MLLRLIPSQTQVPTNIHRPNLSPVMLSVVEVSIRLDYLFVPAVVLAKLSTVLVHERTAKVSQKVQFLLIILEGVF
jgi:hypothetical protein